jgi:uncharacterized protein
VDAQPAEPPVADSAPPVLQRSYLRPPKHMPSPRAIAYWSASAARDWLVLLAIIIVGPILLHWQWNWLPTAWIIVAATGLAHIAVMPSWRYRVHRWETVSTAAYTVTGWLDRTTRIVPFSRVQTVTVHQTLLGRLFDLANVSVSTAHSGLTITCLRHTDAERIADEMSAIVAATKADDAT